MEGGASIAAEIAVRLDQAPARGVRVPVAGAAPLASLLGDADAGAWELVRARGRGGQVLTLPLEKYPGHVACLLTRGGVPTLVWFRGDPTTPCTSGETPLSLADPVEIEIFTHPPPRAPAVPALTLRRGTGAPTPVSAADLVRLGNVRVPAADDSGRMVRDRRQAGGDGRDGKRDSDGAGASLGAVLGLAGSVDEIASVTAVTLDGERTTVPATAWAVDGTGRLKQNRRGEVTLRWAAADGAVAQVRRLAALELTP
ncbi:MAG: hypothetical protein R2939_20290 [Kofleriaceae bacterium]